MKRILGPALLILMLTSASSSLVGESFASDEARLRFAATQHEIISILISEQEFSRILPEFQAILNLEFRGPNEKLVVQETWKIVERLLPFGQFALAEEIIESSQAALSETESTFNLLMLKGKVLKEQGRLREAVEVYRRAQQLQR